MKKKKKNYFPDQTHITNNNSKPRFINCVGIVQIEWPNK